MNNCNVIIIGLNHHNTLGVIRALGEKGIFSSLILTAETKYSYVKKSKYLKKVVLVKEDSQSILEALEKFKEKQQKSILIPTSDYAALVIDDNLMKLKRDFIVPSINRIPKLVKKYMDKYIQHDLVNQYHILQARSWNVKVVGFRSPKKLSFPCIVKPLVSATGEKSDITICKTKSVLENTLVLFKEKGYKTALIQEYINYDMECGLIGCCHNKKVIMPGVIEKMRIFPEKRGNVSFGKIVPLSQISLKWQAQIQGILNILTDLNYSGMFDIEVFIKGENIYVNEINFRNSGNSYAYVCQNVYIVYLWILMVLGKNIQHEIQAITREYFFCDEYLELQQLKYKKISFKTWIHSMKQSQSFFIWNLKDWKVVVYKYIYAVLKRLRKE